VLFRSAKIHRHVIRTAGKGNGEGKLHHRTGHEGPKDSSTLFLTSALDGVGGQQAATAFSPEMTRYTLYRRLGGPQVRSGRVRKISPPTGIRSPTLQLVDCRFTD
jgi:hypothetical protein